MFQNEEEIMEYIHKQEEELKEIYHDVDLLCEKNSLKVLKAFQKNHLSESHFNSTTGYGYNDIGREVIEKIYADI